MAEGSGGSKLSGDRRKIFLRLLQRAALGVVLIFLLGWIGSNLWLLSPWGTGMVERKLEERFNRGPNSGPGLEWEIGSMTWSPWNGLTVNRTRVFLPGEAEQSIVAVTDINIRPYWKPLLKGKLRLREITLNEPRVELSLEMLAALPSDGEVIETPPPVAPAPPTLAAGQAQEIPAKPLAQFSLADYAQALRPRGAGSQVLAQQKPKVEEPVPPAAKRAAAGLPMRLRVNGASMRLFSESKEVDLLSVDELSLDLPLSGEDAEGHVKISGLKMSSAGIGTGTRIDISDLPDVNQTVVWKRPRLEIEETEVDLGGVKLNMRVQLGLKNTKSSLPFLVDMAIRPQQVEPVAWLEQRSMHASAKLVAGRFRLLGLLADPLNWKAEAVVVGEGVTVQAGQGRPRVTFDTIYLPAILHQGRLHWVGFKMLGEDFSVLGNGRLSMRGGLISITRLVASPEVAEVMEKSFRRAGMVEKSWWYDMYTPDRKVRDLLVSGSILNPKIDAGPRHASMQLSQLIRLALNPGINKNLQEGDGGATEPLAENAEFEGDGVTKPKQKPILESSPAETPSPAENHNDNENNNDENY
ncbi:hypothetical protein N9496_06295 [Akkermansiaceae bacterium]|nr:hypothetical protein [Akkermansiaceae bacterium]